jgi:hypothetical protein
MSPSCFNSQYVRGMSVVTPRECFERNPLLQNRRDNLFNNEDVLGDNGENDRF